MNERSKTYGSDRGFPDLSKAVASVRKTQVEVVPPMRCEEWINDFGISEDLYPDEFRNRWLSADERMAITHVYGDGLVVGTYTTASEKFQVFAHRDSDKPPSGCSCRVSNGTDACTHGFQFIRHILQQLQKPSSELTRRIERQAFDAGHHDMSVFEFDGGKLVLSLLDSIANGSHAETNYGELEPALHREPSRLVWHLSTEGNGLRIDPFLQPALKRGGYGKGKKTKLTSLFQDNLSLCNSDLRVRSIIKSHSDHYATSYYLPLDEALLQLVGANNVMLDGEPATVAYADAVLNVVKEPSGHFRFRVSDSSGKISSVILSDNCIIQVDRENRIVRVCRSSSTQNSILRQLVGAASVPERYHKELLERVQKLQNVISLRLHESIAGPLIPETVTPVIILRSCKDGALDFGIRVRDSRGVLFKPCEGVLIHPSTRDGKPIQLVRQVQREGELMTKLLDQLGIGGPGPNGSVEGFEAGLDLIDRLQSSQDSLEVLWDKSSEQPIKYIGTVSASNVRVGISQKRDWFNLTGECKVGDHSLDIAALLQGLRGASAADVRGEFVRLGESGWARISDQLRTSLKRLDDSINTERGALRFDRTSAIAIRDAQQHIQVDSSRAWNDCLERLGKSEKLEPVLPSGLKASLRDYQLEGYKWLRRLAEWGVGGILADDMGLGKTVQTLAAVLDRAAAGPALVIAPTSVCFNWMREIEKFAPELLATMYRETDRSDFLENVGPNHVVVCSYGLALRDAKKLAKVGWSTMVLDEAQAIKNSRSKTSLAIASIPSQWTVGLTGTPVENHLGELWSLLHVVSPGVLGGWDQFRNRFASPIEKSNDEERREALRNRLTPFILRRTKGQVLKDLPARTEMNLVVELSPAERAIYDQVRLSAIGEADTIANLKDVQDQRFRILALLTRLRQIACHPKLVHESWNQGSAKLTQLSETLLQLREEGHRVLIFSQFVKHLALIREMMDQEQITYQYLDGTTPAAARQTEVDRFQSGDATAFLISLKAGGTGLNLTAADYVIHMDPWWNPAVEDQATDRAHRIGQDKPVMVYRIVAQNTIEEEILRLHETKRDLVAGILDGTHSAAKLSTEDLIALLKS
jgi:superfamily II DNA or RNA helicase